MKRLITYITIGFVMLAITAAGYAADAPATGSEPARAAAVTPAELENAVEFTTSVETHWRVQDAVTATIKNPLSTQLKGTISFTVPGQKPEKRRFKVAAGKSESIKFAPEVVWDGLSSLKADATITFDGFATPVVKQVDLGTSHRVSARVACPLARILEFRIASPAKHKVKGKLRLLDVKGIKPQTTLARFEVDSQTVVSITLLEPAPSEFSFAYLLTDGAGKVIFRTPVLNYTIIESFSSVVDGEPLQDYVLALDGDQSVTASASAEGAKRDTTYVAVPSLPVCKLKYDLGSGRSVRLMPKKELATAEKLLEVGFWIQNDGAANSAYCRLADANGQIFRSKAFPVDWQGWRYKTAALVGANCELCAGGEGKLIPPFRWDSLFVLDNGDKPSRGTIFLGPVMLVSAPAEQPVNK